MESFIHLDKEIHLRCSNKLYATSWVTFPTSLASHQHSLAISLTWPAYLHHYITSPTLTPLLYPSLHNTTVSTPPHLSTTTTSPTPSHHLLLSILISHLLKTNASAGRIQPPLQSQFYHLTNTNIFQTPSLPQQHHFHNTNTITPPSSQYHDFFNFTASPATPTPMHHHSPTPLH